MFVCLWRAGGVCCHDNSKLRASIFTKLGLYIVAGSDHLQLIKFWRSCDPGKGVCGGEEILALKLPALLQPSQTLCVYGGTAAGAQCLHLSERFFI